MYFTVNLAFVSYFDNWIDSIILTINHDITEDEQTLPISLQDLTQILQNL